jgi:hypothetical protein
MTTPRMLRRFVKNLASKCLKNTKPIGEPGSPFKLPFYFTPRIDNMTTLIQRLNYLWRATIMGVFGGPAFRYQYPSGASGC